MRLFKSIRNLFANKAWKEFWWPVGTYDPIIEYNSSRDMYRLWVDTGVLNSEGYWKEMTREEIMNWRQSITQKSK